VKRGTLRWFGHVETMNENEFVERVYRSEIEGSGVSEATSEMDKQSG